MSIVAHGFRDDPAKAYLVVGDRRHWITTPVLLQQCEVVAIEKATRAADEGPPIYQSRDFAALKFLKGDGVEIGALNCPAVLPHCARVTYVDYISPAEARLKYPGVTVPDNVVVDDGEKLDRFDPASLNFIVANHFLEHTRNPLGVLRVHLSKLKPGGILIYALPNKDMTFDKERPITSFQHLVMDDQHGPEISDWFHYLEFARYCDGLTDPWAIEAKARLLRDTDDRIHFHVWDARAIREMFTSASDYLGSGFRLVESFNAGLEVVTVLQKN